jgi:hypothetical protein
LTRKEALSIFSYTDEVIYRDLNNYMRWILNRDLSETNINAINNIIDNLESWLDKMPNMEWRLIYRWDNWVGWKKEKWEKIELKSFTSVANNVGDTFLSEDKNILIIVDWKKWKVKDVTSLALIPNFWDYFPQVPNTTNEWIILPNSVVKVMKKEVTEIEWVKIDKIKFKQIK